MKKDDVVKSRELMNFLLQDASKDNVDKTFISFFNARLSHELDIFMAGLYEMIYKEAIINDGDYVSLNVELKDIKPNGNFKVFILRVFKEFDKILFKRNITFDVDNYVRSIQKTDFEKEDLTDICRVRLLGVEMFFRKSELIERLNMNGYENCYEFYSGQEEEEISSFNEMMFRIPSERVMKLSRDM